MVAEKNRDSAVRERVIEAIRLTLVKRGRKPTS
jgi:hypothetical protein